MAGGGDQWCRKGGSGEHVQELHPPLFSFECNAESGFSAIDALN